MRISTGGRRCTPILSVRCCRERLAGASAAALASAVVWVLVGCGDGPEGGPFDHGASAERHWTSGPAPGADVGEGDLLDRLADLWPDPSDIDEGAISRLGMLADVQERIAAMRAARGGADGGDVEGGDGGMIDNHHEAQSMLLEFMGADLGLSAKERASLRRLGEAMALRESAVWSLADPTGSGVVSTGGMAAMLQYLGDFGLQHQQAILGAFDADGDGRLSAAEGAAAAEGVRRRIEGFERLRGIDMDLDGRIDTNEMELFLRYFQRGEARADLDGDGVVGSADLARFLRAIQD